MDRELPLRITVLRPPSGVIFRLQRGKAELSPPTQASEQEISFGFGVRIGGNRPDGRPNLLGAFAQGPPASRFVYVNSGTLAGQLGSCWTRRAKVPLTSITWELIEEVLSTGNAVLEARIAGTARDGGPACATVPLLEDGWKVSPKSGKE